MSLLNLFKTCILDWECDVSIYSAFLFSLIYYNILLLYLAILPYLILLLLFYLSIFLLVSFSFQLSLLSVLGCGFGVDLLSALKILILNSEDFDLIFSMSYFDIPLFKSIERPGKYLVLASRKSCAIIFKATSSLSETFLF